MLSAQLLDPVCGMIVGADALRADGYDDVAFCAPGCRTAFLNDPGSYPDRLTAQPESAHGCACSESHGRGHLDQTGHTCECSGPERRSDFDPVQLGPTPAV